MIRMFPTAAIDGVCGCLEGAEHVGQLLMPGTGFTLGGRRAGRGFVCKHLRRGFVVVVGHRRVERGAVLVPPDEDMVGVVREGGVVVLEGAGIEVVEVQGGGVGVKNGVAVAALGGIGGVGRKNPTSAGVTILGQMVAQQPPRIAVAVGHRLVEELVLLRGEPT